jgi:chaperonin GroES
MKFKPLGDRVLAERVEDATTTASGIIIPDNAKEKPSQGKIVAVSEDVENISVGDIVVFGKYSGNELTLDGTEYLILEADEIFGIIK